MYRAFCVWEIESVRDVMALPIGAILIACHNPLSRCFYWNNSFHAIVTSSTRKIKFKKKYPKEKKVDSSNIIPQPPTLLVTGENSASRNVFRKCDGKKTPTRWRPFFFYRQSSFCCIFCCPFLILFAPFSCCVESLSHQPSCCLFVIDTWRRFLPFPAHITRPSFSLLRIFRQTTEKWPASSNAGKKRQIFCSRGDSSQQTDSAVSHWPGSS